MTADKSVRPVSARRLRDRRGRYAATRSISAAPKAPDCARPVLTIDGRPDGAMSANGQVQGTYVHGLFTSDSFRHAWLKDFGLMSTLVYEERIESALDALADHLERHLDVERMIAIARTRQSASASAA